MLKRILNQNPGMLAMKIIAIILSVIGSGLLVAAVSLNPHPNLWLALILSFVGLAVCVWILQFDDMEPDAQGRVR